jgi:hypothetical protein
MKSVLLISSAVLATLAQQLKFEATDPGVAQASIRFSGTLAGRDIIVGDANTCTKIDGNAKCIKQYVDDKFAQINNRLTQLEGRIDTNMVAHQANTNAHQINAANISTNAALSRARDAVLQGNINATAATPASTSSCSSNSHYRCWTRALRR